MLSPLQSFSTEQRPCIWRPYAIVSLVLLIACLAWETTAWDMSLERLWGEPSGFALRDNWWMTKIMHDGARNLGWVFLSTLLIGIWRPWGSLKALATADRVGLFLTVLSALLPVTLIKGFSQTTALGTFRHLVDWRPTCRIGTSGLAMAAAVIAFRQATPLPALLSWRPTLVFDKTMPLAPCCGWFWQSASDLFWGSHSKCAVRTS